MRLLRRAAIAALFLAIAVAISPVPAAAWGCKGHQVVALVAEKHLTPHAREMMQKILAASPIDPNLSRYCKEGGIDPMVDASTWADDIRSQRPKTSPWHYIDIPLGTALGATHGDLEKFCSTEGCLISAIRDELKTLRSPDAGAPEKADAFRSLIHFVGDLHQPLHAVSNNDLGGNCVPVTFFDETPQLRNQALEIYGPNLHAVWDTDILERDTPGKTVDQLASELESSLQGKITRWKNAPPDIDSWAWESYQVAVKSAYGKLPVHITSEAPKPVSSCSEDEHISSRMLQLNERLTEPYQLAAAPIVRSRLAEAGARLALLLNRLWP